MGRPRDEFAWSQVEALENGTWRCMYCSEEFKGAASRIRNHLSGQGNDISACAAAPQAIRNQALSQIKGKRVRGNSSLDMITSSSNGPASIEKRANEEYVIDAFLKLLMSYNCSPSTLDFIKDPDFKEFLERAHKHGVPSSLLVSDSVAIRRSLFNTVEDVYQHTLMLKETWNTSGCTLMVFTRTRSSPVHDVNKDLDFDDAITYMILRHNVSRRGGSGNDWTRRLKDECLVKPHMCRCLRDEIEEMCIDICRESEWAASMINNAVELHDELCSHESLRLGYYEIIERDSESFKDFDNTKGMPALRLSIFLSVMRLNFGLRQKLISYIERNSLGGDVAESLEVIFLDNEYDVRQFWDQGRKLQIILSCILRVLDLMDTLVPTSGVLAMALEMVEYKLCGSTEPILELGEDSYTFWKECESKLRRSIDDKYIREAAMYMNPLYCTRLRKGQGPQFQTKVKKAMIEFVYGEVYDSEDESEVEWADLIRELECYDDVFTDAFATDGMRRNYHPVKLWEEYGHELPLLRKHAINLLSQPLNCICKQVKKHLYELSGADDYILRLNVRKMHEIKLTRDDIYSPAYILFGDWL